jgi:hypothetical protein
MAISTMTNGQLATLASGALRTIRRVIEEDRRHGPQAYMVPAYGHAWNVLDMLHAMTEADLLKCDQLDDHIYILRGIAYDLRDGSPTFGYHD